MLDFWAEPEIAKRCSSKAPPHASIPAYVPVTTRKNLYLHPYHFSVSETAKYGVVGRWPSNVQVRTHFSSIIMRGYEAEKEAIEVKYPKEFLGKEMQIFTTEFIDGHAKSVMVQGVFALLDYLDPRLKKIMYPLQFETLPFSKFFSSLGLKLVTSL